jgi:hypothetical protein
MQAKKIKETDFIVNSPNDALTLGGTNKLDKDDNVYIDKEAKAPSSIEEIDAVIQPQDKETIKYLSDVEDANTGEISKPFTIADKNYQMIMGQSSNGGVVMAVFCHDDTDENGENIIYSVDEFEQKIAIPMKEMIEMGDDFEMIQEEPTYEETNETYEGYKHFFVNRKTNEIKKFKTIEEMLTCGKHEEEEYMPTTNFKRYMTEKLFGRRNRNKDVTIQEGFKKVITKQKLEESIKPKKVIKTIKKKDL